MPTGPPGLRFVGLSTLTPGQHTVTVENKGPQPHEATLVKLSEGTTVEQSSRPSLDGVASTAALDERGWHRRNLADPATMDIEVEAGDYAFICFVPDPASGAPR